MCEKESDIDVDVQSLILMDILIVSLTFISPLTIFKNRINETLRYGGGTKSFWASQSKFDVSCHRDW